MKKTKHRRTPQELIDESKKLAKGAFFSRIVGRFKGKAVDVANDGPDQLEELTAFMRQGGEPMGVFRVDWQGGGLHLEVDAVVRFVKEGRVFRWDNKGQTTECSIRLFDQCADQEGIETFVDATIKGVLTGFTTAIKAEIQCGNNQQPKKRNQV